MPASGCPTLGLRMAAERRLSDIGMVSLLIVHQPTLREALEVLSEFRNGINSNLTLQVDENGDTVFLREQFALNPPVVSRQVNDVALGSCTVCVRRSWATGGVHNAYASATSAAIGRTAWCSTACSTANCSSAPTSTELSSRRATWPAVTRAPIRL